MKVVLVTGGAGEIGSAICRKFAQNGYSVVITYHTNAEKAQNLCDELNANNAQKINHVVFHAPTTDSEKLMQLADFIKINFGHLNVLVNNAGITVPVAHTDLDGLSDDWIDKILQTNFRGSFAMCRAMKSLLLQNPDKETGSLIVNISSVAGVSGIGSNVAYCASKAAVDSMTRSLARALAPKIRVVSVSPGFVEGEYTKTFDKEFLDTQKKHTPLGRFAQAIDVANATFAAAETLTFCTGNIISVDGGRLLH